ncbi:hypothetical protein SKAU_G00198820 [Synaphobranchus kaupii]|uniref:Uncharacterized protein n=1 Tax=Synaphobranchus kaupii TaxID=118154 RepID=A0A9Q1FFI1_SYNKA|nr:hypothetical protein SKAU_G00198820 [Synaphobranchus kaupii]
MCQAHRGGTLITGSRAGRALMRLAERSQTSRFLHRATQSAVCMRSASLPDLSSAEDELKTVLNLLLSGLFITINKRNE